MRSEGSESGPDSPGTDAATAGSRSGAGSPPPTTHDGSPHGSPGGMDGCGFFCEPVAEFPSIRENFEHFSSQGNQGKTGGFQQKSGKTFSNQGNFPTVSR